MAFADTSLTVLLSLWEMLKFWLSIFFVIPFKNLEILWILIPIWINLIFTDFFQEKRGTGLGNAVTNGAVMLWVGVDWIRFLIRAMSDSKLGLTGAFIFKFSLCAFVILGGLTIIVLGVMGKKVTAKIGRVRETSYIMLVLSPVIYGVAEISWRYLGIIVLFMPLFYGFFALIDKIIPNPKTYQVTEELFGSGKDFSSDFGSDIGSSIDSSLNTQSMEVDSKLPPMPNQNTNNFKPPNF